jgi:DNA-binding beta-propeller fold protein YncE
MRPGCCRRRLLGVVGAVVIIPVGTAGCGALGTNSSTTATKTVTASPSSTTASGQTAPAPGQSAPTTASSGQGAPSTPSAGNAVVLPFTGLDHPVDVVVGAGGGIDGAVYVTDRGNNRVVKLAGNSYTQTVLPVTGLNKPAGLVLNGDDVLITDANSSRMLWGKVPQKAPTPPWQADPGSSSVWVGPFTGLQSPHGVTVMNWSMYVADSGNNRVMRFDSSGTNAPDVVTFTGLNNPTGVTVVNTGLADLFVVDSGNNRVLEMNDGSNQPQAVLGFTGLNNPHGVAVDSGRNVFVVDSGNNRVVRLSKDPTTQVMTQSILPFMGLNDPEGVFVDQAGNLYVVDSGNNRVLKLDKAFARQ